MLDECAAKLCFEVAHAIVLVRTTGAHHVVSDKTMVGRVADGGIVGHDGWVEVVMFSVQSAAVPCVSYEFTQHEYELSAYDIVLRTENEEVSSKGLAGQPLEKGIGRQWPVYLIVVQVGQYIVEGW